MTALTFLVSCEKSSDHKLNANSRKLRYIVPGDFTGSLIVSYTSANGSMVNDQVSLPWIKEIIYNDSVGAAVLLLTGNGGIAGQKVTLTTKRNGSKNEFKFEAVTEPSGSFSKSAPVYVF